MFTFLLPGIYLLITVSSYNTYGNFKVLRLLCPQLKSSTPFNGKIATQGIQKEVGIFIVKFSFHLDFNYRVINGIVGIVSQMVIKNKHEKLIGYSNVLSFHLEIQMRTRNQII